MIGFVIGGTKCAVCIGEIENDEMKIVNKKTVPTNFSITPYENGLKAVFKKNARDIYAWSSPPPENYEKLKQAAFEKLDAIPCGCDFIHMRHGEKAAQEHCLSPFRHMHIAWNGNVLYCTDHYDFSAGNVHEDGLIDIFNNELSEKFRHEVLCGNCASCRHCSWKNNMHFGI